MANIYDVEGLEQFLPEQKKPLSSFLNDYATIAQEVSSPYVGMAGKYGFGNDPAKIQGLGSDVRHTTGSALGKFGIQDYYSQFGLDPNSGLSNFIGNAGIMGSTAVQEISDAIRGFKQAGLEGAINQPMEDVSANLRAKDLRYGTPLEDIVNFAVSSSPSAYMSNPPAEPTISRFNAPGPFNYGTAQAAEVDPFAAERARLVEAGIDPMSVGLVGGTGDPNRPTMADIAGMGDLGNPTGDPRVVSEEMGMVGRPTTSRPTMADIAGEINENLRDLGNPTGDPRIGSEEQGLSGFPGIGPDAMGTVDPGFQNVLDAREARRNEIAMQQNPDYGQFFDAPPVNEQKRGLANLFDNPLFGLGMRLSPIGPLQDLGKLMGVRNAYNSFRSGALGDAVSSARTGIGSLGSRFAGKMRGINPNTGRANTQAEYEANRANRSLAKRQANMIARKNANKSYSQKNLDAVTKELNRQNTAREKAKTQKSQNPNLRSGANSGGGGGRSKIVCTMMNDRYGFGSFRNKIWMKFHESYGPEYQKGYHAIFLPLVKIAKGEGKINTAVRKVLEHMGRHVTADMFKIMKGKKRDTLGRIYRAIFEPACHIIGKIKSALGRG